MADNILGDRIEPRRGDIIMADNILGDRIEPRRGDIIEGAFLLLLFMSPLQGSKTMRLVFL
jgi:hypothetical protein